MGTRIEQNFFRGRSPNGQNRHEEMVNISDHKRNANQKHIKISPHSF
jgi:hypothetical protein